MRLRRVAAALLAALTVGLALQLALTRPAPEDVPALVAVRAVPPGQVVRAGDVQVRRLPPQALPDAVLTSAEQAIDRPAAVPLVAGRTLVAADLHTASLLTGLAEGTTAVFLPLAEAEVPAALVPADRVDVHSPVDGSVVVPGAVVLRTTGGERPGAWLAVDRAGAQALAVARGSDPAGASLQIALLTTPSGE